MILDFRFFAIRFGFLWLVFGLFSGCYTFKGISLDPEDKTFFIKTFETQANNAPPNLGIDFTERLKEKIRQETKLTLEDEKPDLEFSGKIVDYRVDLLAPKPGEIATSNKLVIVYSLLLTNNREGSTSSWKSTKSFSHFAEFPNTSDLLSVQDALIKEINDQVLEDIFNAAFNNW